MNRYKYNVAYSYPKAEPPYTAHESIVVRAETEAAAVADVDSYTQRWERFSGAVKTVTLVLTTGD
jgi:hypothetical protein